MAVMAIMEPQPPKEVKAPYTSQAEIGQSISWLSYVRLENELEQL